MTLPDVAAPQGQAWRRMACDVLVVGGGIAGLTAARELGLAGRSVIVVDARRVDQAPSALDEARTAAQEAGCRVLPATLCVGLYEDPRRALCVDDVGSLVIAHADVTVATGAYDRLVTFSNNDLPGIVGVRALERLAAQAAIPRGATIGVYGEQAETTRALKALQRAGVSPLWVAGPGALSLEFGSAAVHSQASLTKAEGADRIRAVHLSTAGRMPCDLLVIAFSQPGYELQMQRGAVLHAHGLPRRLVPDVEGTRVLVVGEAAGEHDEATAVADARRRTRLWLDTGRCWVSMEGAAYDGFRQANPDAFVCLCEDVRVRDISRAIEDGYDDIELIKRHTGAATGPCQGKLCHANLMDCVASHGLEVKLPTQRPLVRPVPFARFAGAPQE